ncbi:nucleotidyltransferase domain-containing protein [Duganella ginsengisoli]|uniref:Nucleotidyltransferase domain-containing protein n=1 Tax=Pseudoduganella ginsengisoli TaxID=1462440 RepID=A0A6L6PVC8_9BURK|nr:nucleotidyltransferase domain-containing protein [Pseudoduganella ginsengisoli]
MGAFLWTECRNRKSWLCCERHCRPCKPSIYLFGSHAQGTANRGSDLDLAVLPGARLDPPQVWNIGQGLASTLDCDVDLVDLRSASTVMQYQVVTTGRRLWSSGLSTEQFECMVLSEKTALDEARAGLMQDIQKDGSVYGSTAHQ